MTGRAEGIVRYLCIVLVVLIATGMPATAHHQVRYEGGPVGLVIPAIAHGEMLVLAKYRARILDIADRQSPTDETLRRLAGFVSLQYFACFWGVVPGSLSDETGPFNECSHAYLAGVRALLTHLTTMSGDQSSAKGLEARIAEELASDPTFGTLCVNSNEVFDSGIVIGPDWQLAPTHLPTVLTFSLLAIALVAGMLIGPLIAACCQAYILNSPTGDGSARAVGAGQGCGDSASAADT